MRSPNAPGIVGVGRTAELSLRVSVGTLARVVFPDPANGETMLALEHKGTISPGEGASSFALKAQPFGGAVRLFDLTPVLALVDRFHFDSERSRSERDFRLFIRPADWQAVREFCLRRLRRENDPILETGPDRELAEEFEDALGVAIRADQYTRNPVGTVVENEPAPSGNAQAPGVPTVRIYRVHAIRVVDPDLCRAMAANSARHPGRALRRLASEGARSGGRGWANAVLVAGMQEVRAVYTDLPPDRRGDLVRFQDTHLDANVAALLEDLDVPRYRWVH